jgi:uroporphyrin-III C-methyltransferase
MSIVPKLTLVGAGPGDPELISLKGIRALRSADVVLYDALVDPALLKYATNALKIFVGKRSGRHEKTQEEINELIVDLAFRSGHVVRLKGGDPFIFGRGAEEIGYARSYGIEATVIPGISSATAVPALAGISLTQRGISESFWVLTGSTINDNTASDLRLAAGSNASVVILMGVANLGGIIEIFKEAGREETPVALIENGSRKDSRTIYGKVRNILDLAENSGLRTPAIIVIGNVVQNRVQLHSIHEQFSQL